jgi:hypothetical protein
MAEYTAEQALQCLPTRNAQRMAGKMAFWPHGMDIEDLFTMVEILIEAGSTGKPRQQTDVQAWSTILPLIQQTLKEVAQAMAQGDLPMANALIELVKETMLRFGDESDVERFIPRKAPPGSPGSGASPPAIQPQVTISLKGTLTTATSEAMAQPVLTRDAASAPPPTPAPGGAPPGGAPSAPGPAAPPPGAGP